MKPFLSVTPLTIFCEAIWRSRGGSRLSPGRGEPVNRSRLVHLFIFLTNSYRTFNKVPAFRSPGSRPSGLEPTWQARSGSAVVWLPAPPGASLPRSLL